MIIVLLSLVIGFICGVGATKLISSSNSNTNKEVAELIKYTRVKQKNSDDKHVRYLKDYKGLFISDFADYDGDFYESYPGYVHINFIIRTNDGSKVTEKNMDEYIVQEQNYKPNTKINVKYSKDGLGYPSSYSPNEVELRVIRVNGNSKG